MSPMSAIPISARSQWLGRAGWAVFNALQLLFTLTFTASLIVVALLVMVVQRSPRGPLRMASRLWAPGLLRGAGARLEVHGVERIDWSRPYVLVCNHQSMIDVCAMFRAVPVPLRFVLKQELGRVPFLGWYSRAMGMVFIDRSAPRAAHGRLHAAAAQLRAGASVCTFAEGTRGRDGRVAPFKAGAFQLAIDAGVELLPVAIDGSGEVLPAAGFRVRPGTIRVRFGTPMTTAGCRPGDRRALAQRCRDAVLELLAERQGRAAGERDRSSQAGASGTLLAQRKGCDSDSDGALPR
jgi:1-acyl-sn-glycerol-3-phosphate acyltransferase